jgi:hypothetical protein
VPPAAMLVGIVLDDIFATAAARSVASTLLRGAALCGVIALGTLGVVAKHPVLHTLGLVVLGVSTAAVLVFAVTRSFAKRAGAPDPASASASSANVGNVATSFAVGAATIAGGLLTLLVGLDLAQAPGGDTGGAARLVYLFTYNYKRLWPETLDFRTTLLTFGVAATALYVALGVQSLRREATIALCTLSITWGVWGTDVFMPAVSPHWGQHEVIEAYYRSRSGPEEQLVAYQMNWKGENFYTSNRIPAFVSSGATFSTWLKKERDKGAKTMFFVTEHSRINGLRSEVGAKSYKELTTKSLCNKFVLVRAEL